MEQVAIWSVALFPVGVSDVAAAVEVFPTGPIRRPTESE